MPISTDLFKTREDAINSLANDLIEDNNENYTYPVIRSIMNEHDLLELPGGDFVTLLEARFSQLKINYEERYRNKLKELASIVYPDSPAQRDDFALCLLNALDGTGPEETYPFTFEDIGDTRDSILDMFPEKYRDDADDFLIDLFSDNKFL